MKKIIEYRVFIIVLYATVLTSLAFMVLVQHPYFISGMLFVVVILATVAVVLDDVLKKLDSKSSWLLERYQTDDGMEYLTVAGSAFEWTTNKLEALRLQRREDADMLAEIVDDCQHIRVHNFNIKDKANGLG